MEHINCDLLSPGTDDQDRQDVQMPVDGAVELHITACPLYEIYGIEGAVDPEPPNEVLHLDSGESATYTINADGASVRVYDADSNYYDFYFLPSFYLFI